jgi:hypothetical protein
LIRIETREPTRVIAALTAWAGSLGEPELPELSVTRPSLEDIYLEMVRAAEPGGQA